MRKTLDYLAFIATGFGLGLAILALKTGVLGPFTPGALGLALLLIVGGLIGLFVEAARQAARFRQFLAKYSPARRAGSTEETMEGTEGLDAAGLLVLAELETTAARIEMVRMTRPHPHYSENFNLPMTQWQAYGKVFADNSPDTFKVLADAYKAIQWVNDAQVMRRTRQGDSRLPLAVIDDDHLDDAQSGTAAAIAALRKGSRRRAVPQVAPLRPSNLGSVGSITMRQSIPGSHIHHVKFDTGVQPGQRIPLPFKASAIRLIKPAPHDPNQLIRATDVLPIEAHFDTGRLVVHGFADNGIDVELHPPDRVFEVEVDVYEPTTSSDRSNPS